MKNAKKTTPYALQMSVIAFVILVYIFLMIKTVYL